RRFASAPFGRSRSSYAAESPPTEKLSDQPQRTEHRPTTRCYERSQRRALRRRRAAKGSSQRPPAASAIGKAATSIVRLVNEFQFTCHQVTSSVIDHGQCVVFRALLQLGFSRLGKFEEDP